MRKELEAAERLREAYETDARFRAAVDKAVAMEYSGKQSMDDELNNSPPSASPDPRIDRIERQVMEMSYQREVELLKQEYPDITNDEIVDVTRYARQKNGILLSDAAALMFRDRALEKARKDAIKQYQEQLKANQGVQPNAIKGGGKTADQGVPKFKSAYEVAQWELEQRELKRQKT